jgi:hypothetical protein
MNFDKLVISKIATIYDEEYIIEVLYKQNIGKVERIIMIPYISPDDGEIYMTAYINMYYWNNGNYARGFLEALLIQYQLCLDVHLYHFNDLYWTVRLTTNTDIAFNIPCDKRIVCHYSEKYYDTLNWNTDSRWYVNSEFISRRSAEMILFDE